jgi:hypothetical protein
LNGSLHGESEEGDKDDEETKKTNWKKFKNPSHGSREIEKDFIIRVKKKMRNILKSGGGGGVRRERQ